MTAPTTTQRDYAETADELLAELTAKHGPEIAAIAARFISGDIAYTRQRNAPDKWSDQ